MPQRTRTFVALPVPEAQGEKLARLQEQLGPEVSGVRWVLVRPFHLTLAFLGDVDDTDLNDVCRAVNAAAAGFGPFHLRLEGLGVFPNPSRPRTLWVGLIGPGLETLTALQNEVARAVRDAGYPPDEKTFHPHVTLGRLRPGRGPGPDLGPVLRHHKGWSAGSFRVAEAVTYASTLTPDGPEYAPLGTAPLLAGKAG